MDEEKKRYVLKNPDDFLELLKELEVEPVPIPWKIGILKKNFPTTGKTWKRGGEYPEVTIAPNYLSIKQNNTFAGFARSNIKGMESFYEKPPHVKGRGTKQHGLTYTGSEYDKGYEGKGVSFIDPARGGEVIDTLYLDKDGVDSLYTQATPKNKEIIVPDALQRIMDDIGATGFVKYMKGASRLWLSPKIPLENLREGMVLNLDVDSFSSGGVGKVVKIEPKGEIDPLSGEMYDVTFDRMIDESWVKSMGVKYQSQRTKGITDNRERMRIYSQIDPKEKQQYAENNRFQKKQYGKDAFFTPAVEYDPASQKYFVTGFNPTYLGVMNWWNTWNS